MAQPRRATPLAQALSLSARSLVEAHELRKAMAKTKTNPRRRHTPKGLSTAAAFEMPRITALTNHTLWLTQH